MKQQEQDFKDVEARAAIARALKKLAKGKKTEKEEIKEREKK